jgi:hypothetical protein
LGAFCIENIKSTSYKCTASEIYSLQKFNVVLVSPCGGDLSKEAPAFLSAARHCTGPEREPRLGEELVLYKVSQGRRKAFLGRAGNNQVAHSYRKQAVDVQSRAHCEEHCLNSVGEKLGEKC